jgi:hypothetical protein
VQHVVGDKAVIVPFDATGAAVPLAGMASPGGALWVSGYYGRVWRLETDHFALAVPPLVARTVGDLRGVWSDGKQATIAVGNDWIQDTGSGWEHSTLATGVVEADAVWGSSASDVWAVGSYATINHFDGTGWAPVDAGIPSAAKSKMHLYAVSGTPQGEMWAIGQGGQFVHFDGKAYEVGTSASVSDMRALEVMKQTSCPVVFDATHSVQQPGGFGPTGMQRALVPTLARAAVAVGIAGIFLETHPDPDQALSDGPNMWPLAQMEELLSILLELDRVVKRNARATRL